jgi:hypothetical protein
MRGRRRRYVVVQQSLGEPDASSRRAARDRRRSRPRADNRRAAAVHVASWAGHTIATEDRDAFREMAEDELLTMHEGNIARYQIRPGEFAA